METEGQQSKKEKQRKKQRIFIYLWLFEILQLTSRFPLMFHECFEKHQMYKNSAIKEHEFYY